MASVPDDYRARTRAFVQEFTPEGLDAGVRAQLTTCLRRYVGGLLRQDESNREAMLPTDDDECVIYPADETGGAGDQGADAYKSAIVTFYGVHECPSDLIDVLRLQYFPRLSTNHSGDRLTLELSADNVERAVCLSLRAPARPSAGRGPARAYAAPRDEPESLMVRWLRTGWWQVVAFLLMLSVCFVFVSRTVCDPAERSAGAKAFAAVLTG